MKSLPIVVVTLLTVLFALGAGAQELAPTRLVCTETKEIRLDGTFVVDEEDPFAFNYVELTDPLMNVEDAAGQFYGDEVSVDTCEENYLTEVSCVDGKLRKQQYLCLGKTEKKIIEIQTDTYTICRCTGAARPFTLRTDFPEAFSESNLVGGFFGDIVYEEKELICPHCGAKIPDDSRKEK